MAMNARLLRPLATGFDLRRLDGLVGWYDSADLTAMAANSDGTGSVAVGDQVGWWKDKSTTAAHLTQGVAANRPTLTAAAVNGRSSLVFDGSNDRLSRTAYTAQNSLSALTRIAVCENQLNQTAMLSRVSSGGSEAFGFMNGGFRVSVDSTGGTNFASYSVSGNNTAPLAVYASVFEASTLSFRVNNVITSGTINGTIPATTGSGSALFDLGANQGVNFFWAGPIAEYIVFNRALSSAQLTAVYQYLRKKWGFA